MPGVCTYENTAHRRCHQKSANSTVKWAACRHYQGLFGVCTYENTAEGRGTKHCKQKRQVKNRWSRRTGSELHADPPAWIFAVQACNSNYITWKQIQIINTLAAKFRKAHDATPQHDTSKTPKQASPNPSNFGDTWKYLCSMEIWRPTGAPFQ